jgi:hypothetical protein
LADRHCPWLVLNPYYRPSTPTETAALRLDHANGTIETFGPFCEDSFRALRGETVFAHQQVN